MKIRCPKCGTENVVDQKAAANYYNHRIHSYFNDLSGTILDLGCGGGFLSRYLMDNKRIKVIYGLDQDEACNDQLTDMTVLSKFQFLHSDIAQLSKVFAEQTLDFLVSRDVFMFIEDTDRYFDDVTNLVTSGIRQMGWFISQNERMKNQLTPEQIVEEYRNRGWNVCLEPLEWYKSGYFIRADRQ
ncbi:class I SAM-dependent methyltransferase [Sporolactobacillus laevolacticus]|uniref:class I SAM-dependent methyltransferase n=1 Tax=Sporolactobacillus laevolacticus TaxID=33018 RepID=UPI0025B3AFC5|nr:class I SAM-dependent methyltransferase [Sporolactobacillus laevolacticus]MDN3956356.1 class I SAM-dependent methyltransferase [Sporolactobacillus laevolacticus]